MGTMLVVTWTIALFSLFISIFWIHIHFLHPSIPREPPEKWPLVSVIIPAYNEEDVIGDCIGSFLELDYPQDKLEIIVVNDGSTDNTAEVANEYEDAHDNVTVYSKENEGKGATLNYGLERVNGKYVVCMDADSMTTPDSLKKLVSAFTDETVGAVTAAMKIFEPETLIQKLQAVEYIMAIWLRRQMAQIDVIQAIPGPFSMYRKDVLDDVGYFDPENLTEDGEMAMRLHYHGYEIRNVPDAYVYTIGPPTLRGLLRQRLRWYRGLFRNSIRYRDMIFSREHGNFGMFYLPLMWGSVGVLLLSVYLFSTSLLRISTGVIQNIKLAGVQYYIPDLSDVDVVAEVLASDFLLILPAVFTFIVGVYVLKYSFEEAEEDITGNIGILFLYMIIYFILLGLFWIASFIEEILRIDRTW